jgi:hypothetical protein
MEQNTCSMEDNLQCTTAGVLITQRMSCYMYLAIAFVFQFLISILNWKVSYWIMF